MYLLWKWVLKTHGYASIDDMDLGEQFVTIFHMLGMFLCWFMLFVAMCGAMGLAQQEGDVTVDSGIIIAYGFLFFMGYIRRQVEMWGLPIIVGVVTFLFTFDIEKTGLYMALTFFFFGPALCLLEYGVIFVASFGVGFKVGNDGEVSMGFIGMMIVWVAGIVYLCTVPLQVVCVGLMNIILDLTGSKANLNKMRD